MRITKAASGLAPEHIEALQSSSSPLTEARGVQDPDASVLGSGIRVRISAVEVTQP